MPRPASLTETGSADTRIYVQPAGESQDRDRSTISFGEVNSQIRQLTIEARSDNICVGVYSNQKQNDFSSSMEYVNVESESTNGEGSDFINEGIKT